LFIVATCAFGLVHILPGDPARDVAGPYASPQALRTIRRDLGLNHSLGHQYTTFLGRAAHGDLGTSFVSHTSVRTEISERLPSDLELILAALTVAVVVGAATGLAGAYWQGRTPDRVGRIVVSLQQSFPDFVLGLILIYLLFFRARLFPAPVGQLSQSAAPPDRITGMIAVDAVLHGDLAVWRDAMAHLALPALTLGIGLAAIFAKIIRSAVSTALAGPSTEFARACGLRERRVVYYAALAARTAVLTYMAIVTGLLLGGVAIIEAVFDWDGAAQWGLKGITQLDLPAIQGFIVVIGAATVLIYLALDVSVLLLDPRVRRAPGRG
jgi:peptide/nickel transport system permease protein